jgi:hypothetical protein
MAVAIFEIHSINILLFSAEEEEEECLYKTC